MSEIMKATTLFVTVQISLFFGAIHYIDYRIEQEKQEIVQKIDKVQNSFTEKIDDGFKTITIKKEQIKDKAQNLIDKTKQILED